MTDAILGIDTVSKVCSVGIYSNEQKLDIYTNESEKLDFSVLELAESVLRKEHLIVAIVVISGPGTYSGLRTGLSVTYGLALGLDCPTAAVTTFEAIVESVSGKFERALLVHPLGRKNFAVQQLSGEKLKGEVQIVDDERLYKFKDDGQILVGEGCSLFGGYEVSSSDRLGAVLKNFDVSQASDTVDQAWYITDPKITSPKIPFATSAQRPLPPR